MGGLEGGQDRCVNHMKNTRAISVGTWGRKRENDCADLLIKRQDKEKVHRDHKDAYQL